ncbi:serine dehydratase subunit alpha family protein [Persicobacter psychrovividus]|uniref:UPF0597 protein PEPS_39570 n=1 Tax=Persicobacter psychrovividus TaxID=387638 RepID=A0ABN6LJN8_9BACT|nr:UPF0597 protein [Persicobacter psychrovividus]
MTTTEHKIDNGQIIDLIQHDVELALGCTEPIAVALAVVKAKEILGLTPESVQLKVSGNMYKNAMSVGIPNTKHKGMLIAAALGVFSGKSSYLLEVLKDVNHEIIEEAQTYVEQGKVEVKVIENVDKLYVEAVVFAEGETANAVIETRHTEFSAYSKNGDIMFERPEAKHAHILSDGSVEGLSIARIYELGQTAKFEEIKFILDTVKYNKRVSEEGLKNNYGLQVGKRLLSTFDKEGLTADLATRAAARAAAGSDARMAGCGLPVMTNSGSGNQGITVTLPVLEMAETINATEEQLARALIVAHAIPIHIKKRIGPLSALCGILPASIGAGAGVAFLKNGGLEAIENVVKYMVANLSGMICDGAKPSCALKIGSSIQAAMQAVNFSVDDPIQPFADGIVHEDVEITIKNLAQLGVKGLEKVDPMMLEVLNDKCD